MKPIDPNIIGAAIRRLIGEAESKVPAALAAELRVILEELQSLYRTAPEKAAGTRFSIDSEQENQLRVKALRAFLRAGGTRALFERLWPSVLADALEDISVAPPKATPSSSDTHRV